MDDTEAAAAKEGDTTTTSNPVVLIGIAVAACGMALMALSLRVRQTPGDFYDFTSYSLTVLDQTQFVSLCGLASLLGGAAGILSGAALAVAGLFPHSPSSPSSPTTRYRNLYYFALVLQLGVSVGYLAAGGTVLQGLQVLDDAIYQSSGTPSAPGSFGSLAANYELAIFNACCAPQGFSAEKYVPNANGNPDSTDTDGYVKPCTLLHQENLLNLRENKIRSCFTDNTAYVMMDYTVQRNRDRVCSALSEARVNVEGKTVPGQPSMEVTTITVGKKVLPIVGASAAPVYGCGAGFAKAFQAIILVWAENVLRPIGMGFIISGALGVLAVVACMVWRSVVYYVKNSETPEEQYARYMREVVDAQKVEAKAEGGQEEFNVAFDPTKRVSKANPMYVNSAHNRSSIPRHALAAIDDKI